MKLEINITILCKNYSIPIVWYADNNTFCKKNVHTLVVLDKCDINGSTNCKAFYRWTLTFNIAQFGAFKEER